MPPPYDLETVVGLLDKYHQRVTYSALGALLGILPRSVMVGRPRSPLNSWVVSAQNGLPTEYLEAEMHPALIENEKVFGTVDELMEWVEQALNARRKSG